MLSALASKETVMAFSLNMPGEPARDLDSMRTPFGAWLKRSRSFRGLTMEALAEKADTTQAAVSQLERGIRNPSRDMVRKLAEALWEQNQDKEARRRLMSEAMRSAGFAEAEGEAFIGTTREFAQSILIEKGYDDTEFAPEEVDQIAQSLEALIEGHIAQKRKREGRD